ncbi:MAG: NADPH:quinone reductase [Planctomycetota bacterium]
MRAAWYERTGDAAEVLRAGDLPDPVPAQGEVRIRIAASGVNPGDLKKRSGAFSRELPYARIVPHSDGAGVVDAVGPGVDGSRLGERVWCFGAQSYRPFGTAAEFCCVPEADVARLPDAVDFELGALLGIPGITAYEAVHCFGEPRGRTVLVQGGAGAVGSIAVAMAKRAGARVVATVRVENDAPVAREAGADLVLTGAAETEAGVPAFAPEGVDHIVEVALGANIALDTRLLKIGGSIAVYATNDPEPRVPVWPLVFKNISVRFLGSDDFEPDRKRAAADALTEAAAEGWIGLPVGARYSLPEIAESHLAVERRTPGRVVVLP